MFFEPLEMRQMMSVSLDNGLLTIEGTDDADSLTVYRSDAGTIVCDDNGEVSEFDEAGVAAVYVYAYGGDDYVAAASDFPLKLVVQGGAGYDTISGGAAN